MRAIAHLYMNVMLLSLPALNWLLIGFGTYVATAALGTSAQLRLVNTHPFRWLHHALFAAIWVTLGAVAIAGWGSPWLIGIAVVALCMAAMPRLKAGTRPHCTCALIGSGAYIASIVWAVVI